ncbi:MAG TPA: tRNA (adenosine(37)-N6)-threonylcarbamoyltransferase complex transferase subunit TsaD [Thermoanaerobaculia bacterium]|nr:tRNA (adenosine(37)-N6)-threonylcarbamoyltransferase complex transferase subunit TsaD [Thermoanaerobaculia bacterium]
MIPPVVLGIETSCDDTACAVLDGHGRVLASVVSSQLAAHRPYGGVVPEIASREHLSNWPAVSAEALAQARISMPQVNVVAATRGPGLVGALLVGLSIGKAMAFALDRPFYAVHHLEGHLYSPFLPPPGEPGPSMPAIRPPESFVGLVVSGGHTSLFAVEAGEVSTLAETRDDAMGEVFDKVGKRLGLPYPQGPRVDQLAERGDPAAHPLPVRPAGDDLFFSYSGLKSQALLAIEKLERKLGLLELGDTEPPQEVLDLLAGFRTAAVAQVLDRLERLHRRRPIGLLAVSGGVAANRLLRCKLTAWAEERGVELRLVPLAWSGDNAAMIAHAALLRHRRGEAGDSLAAEAESRVPLRPRRDLDGNPHTEI